MQTVQVRARAQQTSYPIKIAAGLIEKIGAESRRVIGDKPCRAALISNSTVYELFGREVTGSLRAAGFQVMHWLMKDGEQYKSLHSLEQALEFLGKSGLERDDAVFALGGGVVGDLAGFAAATYLRGISLIQVPTTLLAQIDASVGGKTGINTASGKNLVGAFHQPRLVLIDTNTLQSLPPRELTAGWCEAIKQGAVGDRKLFDRTRRLLKRLGADLSGVQLGKTIASKDLSTTIAAHCRFKASIVAGDEREATTRVDRRSRKILNFGHTTAHALEAVTNYRRFRHGEAVGYGVIVAGEISKTLGMLPHRELELLRQAVASCGRLPRADNLSVDELIAAMKRDKKSISGRINWVLLEGIGKARIVDGRMVSPATLRNALRSGLQELPRDT